MPVDQAPVAPAARRGRLAWLDRLSLRSVAVTLVLGTLVALALKPIFLTPLPGLLGRTLFVAMVLLLAFTAAGQWQQRWLPRWLMQALAVVLAAPLATGIVYLLRVGGDASVLLENNALLMGFALIAGTAAGLGLVLALGALLREREALARSQQLQFELQRNELERQALDARLSLLHSQIEPHFLFNTLANVQALVESGSPRAPAVLASLIAYLRAAMPRLHGENATLGHEAALVRAYLELMHMRMPDRLRFEVSVPEALHGRRFPSMALLTLVENAVRHGIDPTEQGGCIEVGAAEQPGGELHLWVQDSGAGMAETAQPGTGLVNLRSRLAGFFGDGARLRFSEAQPHGLRAEIVIPAAPAAAPP